MDTNCKGSDTAHVTNQNQKFMKANYREIAMLQNYSETENRVKKHRVCKYERNIFGICKSDRPQKKYKNSFSRDEAGTCGSHIVVCRNVGFTTIREPLGKKYGVMRYREYKVRNYGSQVCKTRNMF